MEVNHQCTLFNNLRFYVPLKSISLIWRRHHCRWRASNLGLYARCSGPLSREGSLYRATPAVTRDLGFSGLIRRTAPMSRPLRHTRGCGGSILTRILSGHKGTVKQFWWWQDLQLQQKNVFDIRKKKIKKSNYEFSSVYLFLLPHAAKVVMLYLIFFKFKGDNCQNSFDLYTYIPTKVRLIDWLFTVLRPTQEYFTYMETSQLPWRATKFRPMLGPALRAFVQVGVFVVPYLLWHAASVFPISSEVPAHSVASCDTQGDLEDQF
jgi:hypothetical protein